MSDTLQPTINAAGTIQIVYVDPAAGAEFTLSFDDENLWEILLVRFQLTTSAVAGSRHPRLILAQGGNELGRFYQTSTQGASAVGLYVFYQFAGNFTSSFSCFMAPLPVTGLIGGPLTITSTTSALDAGDQFADVRVLVRKLAAPSWSA